MISTLDKVALESAGSLALKCGFDLGWGPGTATYLTGKGVEGWTGSAPIRRDSTPLLGAHGTHAEPGKKDERLITVTGHHVAASRAAAGLYADDLAAFLGDGEEGVFRVDDASLGSRWAEVYLAPGGVDVTWTGGVDVSFQIHMVAPDSRKYGDPAISPATGVPIPGNGLVFPLFSRMPTTQSTRTNLVTNPSPTSMTGWNASYGASGAGSTAIGTVTGFPVSTGAIVTWTTAPTGAWNVQASGGGYTGVVAGQSVTGSMYGRPSWAGSKACLTFQFFDAAGNSLGYFGTDQVSTPQNVVTRLSNTMTAPANAAKVGLFWDAQGGATFPSAGSTLQVGAAVAEVGAVLGSYFDGATPAAQVDEDTRTTNAWSGAANASTSVQTIQNYAGPNGVLDIGSGGYSGKVSVQNTGTADTGVRHTVWGGNVPGFTITHTGTGRRLVYTELLTAGQSLTLDSRDGSVLLDGYAPRDSKLEVAEWVRLGRGESGTWLFESPGSVNAQMTAAVTPAWW